MDCLFGLETKDHGPTYYQILGCDQNSSIEQINTEYKIKALKLHPDKNLNDEASQNQFKILQEAKETLANPELRKKYDLWLNSGMCMSWKEWANFTEKNKSSFHWVYTKQEPMIMGSFIGKDRELDENLTELEKFRSQSINSDDSLFKFRNYQI